MTSVRLVAAAAAVLSLAACGSGAPARSSVAHGIVTGLVDSAPTCPVERIGTPCPPRPVAAAEVVALLGSARRAVTHTDSHGRFRLTLPYGTYTITATNIGGLASTATKTVQVSASTVQLELTVDSGIR